MGKFEELQLKLNTARKARASQEVLVLSTIIGGLKSNAKMVDGEKVVSDDDVTVALKKHVKNLEETLSHKTTDETLWELNFVKTFLPQQLTEEQLRELWEKFSNLGDYMKHLKENYLGMYDGKLASQIAKK